MNKTNLEAFVWPEFGSDSLRIKAYSKRYKNLSITEAFEAAYNVEIGPVRAIVNQTPGEVKVGDEMLLNILSITKNHVEFDGGNQKTPIVSSVNLHKYDRFKKFLPLEPIKALVMNVTKDRITVDPIAPLVNSYLESYFGQ